MSGPGSSGVDDFNARRGIPQLKTIPKILEGKLVRIPTVLNYKNEPEPVLCKSCIPAYAHAVFIINGIYLLKWDDAIAEAKRIQWG